MGSAIKLPGPSTVFAPKDNPTFTGVVTTPNATIGSLSGLVKAAAGVLSAQAIGAADTKLFIDAAGTGYGWAKGMYLGSTTYDLSTASGNKVITGVGFKPSVVILSCGTNIASNIFSIGIDNGTSAKCVGGIPVLGIYYFPASTRSVYFCVDNTVTNVQYGNITAIGSDGFTIGMVKVGSPTGTGYIDFIAFR